MSAKGWLIANSAMAGLMFGVAVAWVIAGDAGLAALCMFACGMNAIAVARNRTLTGEAGRDE